MTRFWFFLHRAATNHWLQLVVGLCIAASGLWELILVGVEEDKGLIAHGSHGIVLMGILAALVALEHVLYGSKLFGLSVLGEEHEGEGRTRGLFRRMIGNPFFEIFLGIMLLLAGLAEALEDFLGMYPTQDDQVWHFGLILLGMIGIVKGLAGMIKALILVEEAEEKKGWHSRLILSLEKTLRKPHTEVVVAILLIGLGIWEEVYFESHHSDKIWLEAHWGLVLSALNTLAIHLPTIFIGLQLTDDSFRARRYGKEAELRWRREARVRFDG